MRGRGGSGGGDYEEVELRRERARSGEIDSFLVPGARGGGSLSCKETGVRVPFRACSVIVRYIATSQARMSYGPRVSGDGQLEDRVVFRRGRKSKDDISPLHRYHAMPA